MQIVVLIIIINFNVLVAIGFWISEKIHIFVCYGSGKDMEIA